MSNNGPPRLRGSARGYGGPWPIGAIPDRVLYGLGRQLVHRLAVGHADITGDDFGTIFAAAIGGMHRESPLGLADVLVNGTAWSVKTIKHKNPAKQSSVRLISGRNSPDFSLGISNPRKNPENTGRAVLTVWNARLNESLDHYDEIRIAVLVRNMTDRRFRLFEYPAMPFPADDYAWRFNERGNLEGHEKATGTHCFTWQPHGSQFTVIRPVPGSARSFSINKAVPMVSPKHVLRIIRYEEGWISIG